MKLLKKTSKVARPRKTGFELLIQLETSKLRDPFSAHVLLFDDRADAAERARKLILQGRYVQLCYLAFQRLPNGKLEPLKGGFPTWHTAMAEIKRLRK